MGCASSATTIDHDWLMAQCPELQRQLAQAGKGARFQFVGTSSAGACVFKSSELVVKFANNPGCHAIVCAEAARLRLLRGRGAPQVLDLDDEAATAAPFFCMAAFEGRTLEWLMAAQRKSPQDDAFQYVLLTILHHLLRTLLDANAVGVYHTNLTAKNVVIKIVNRKLKFCLFGWAPPPNLPGIYAAIQDAAEGPGRLPEAKGSNSNSGETPESVAATGTFSQANSVDGAAQAPEGEGDGAPPAQFSADGDAVTLNLREDALARVRLEAGERGQVQLA